MEELITRYGIDCQTDNNYVEYLTASLSDWREIINLYVDEDEQITDLNDVRRYVDELDYETIDLMIGHAIEGDYDHLASVEFGDVLVNNDNFVITNKQRDKLDQNLFEPAKAQQQLASMVALRQEV